MSDQEILEKAIQKAIDGGWNKFGFITCDVVYVVKKIQFREHAHGVLFGECDLSTLIFNHDFAKSLWGEGTARSKCHKAPLFQEPRLKDKPLTKPFSQYTAKLQERMTQRLYCTVCKEANGFTSTLDWRTNLRQMVLADDPIKYLGEHLG